MGWVVTRLDPIRRESMLLFCRAVLYDSISNEWQRVHDRVKPACFREFSFQFLVTLIQIGENSLDRLSRVLCISQKVQ